MEIDDQKRWEQANQREKLRGIERLIEQRELEQKQTVKEVAIKNKEAGISAKRRGEQER